MILTTRLCGWLRETKKTRTENLHRCKSPDDEKPNFVPSRMILDSPPQQFFFFFSFFTRVSFGSKARGKKTRTHTCVYVRFPYLYTLI